MNTFDTQGQQNYAIQGQLPENIQNRYDFKNKNNSQSLSGFRKQQELNEQQSKYMQTYIKTEGSQINHQSSSFLAKPIKQDYNLVKGLANQKNKKENYQKIRDKINILQSTIKIDLQKAINFQKQNDEIFKFEAVQVKHIKQYFKICCEKSLDLNKITTFDQIKIINQSMRLTQWMQLCKHLKIFQYFANSRDIVRTLYAIFKRLQNKEKRLNFQNFARAFRILCASMVNYNLQHNKPYNISEVKSYLGIDCQKKHLIILKSMGIKNIKQCKQSINRNKTLQLPSDYLKRSHIKSEYQGKACLGKQNQNSRSFHVKEYKIPVKIYLKREQRIRSRIWKDLKLSNILKLTPTQQMNQSLAYILREDDKYLKYYQKKKKQVTDGLLKRLEKKSNKLYKKQGSQGKMKQQNVYNFFIQRN